ncbi:c-type cytochrome [Limnoglobus roseus]|uniref:Cytochrome c n=1 Tax=Limnoglobus roseus TaxID=2598579 RepID=A0A5C1AE25_9BACT|nr:cytochrome c [Limnoglobus roseus]QEL15374.1 cytochrome c [Limnoglobus roseus]
MRRRNFILLGGGLAILIGVVLALVVAGWPSTDSVGYDPNLRFLLRSDPIIAKLPPTPPNDLHGSGKLDESIADLPNTGGKLLEPAKLPKADRDKLAAVLDDLFGTPAAPKLSGDPLGLTPAKLAVGSRVYKEKCAQCHGSTGDGRGPTGLYVYPHPRDFRLAKFKYISSTVGLTTRDDVVAMVKVGIAGNSMPSFALLPPDQLDAVVDYTLFLALRGKVESDLLSAVLGEDGLTGPPELFAELSLTHWAKRFADAEAKVVRPPVPPLDVKDGGTDAAYDGQVRRGFAAFQTAGCASCHRDYGRETHYLYDDWGVAVRPANLSAGTYRAGGDPLDLFRRIRCGIPPSGMPGVGEGTLSDAQVWDLVLFLKALPVPRHLPDDVRAKIYK